MGRTGGRVLGPFNLDGENGKVRFDTISSVTPDFFFFFFVFTKKEDFFMYLLFIHLFYFLFLSLHKRWRKGDLFIYFHLLFIFFFFSPYEGVGERDDNNNDLV